MYKRLRIIFFVAVAFLLGCIAMLYVDFFNIMILGGIVFNLLIARKEVIANLRNESGYLKLPVFFLLYLGIHTLVLKLFGTGTVKYSYSVFESLLLYFIALPLYICSIKDLLNQATLKLGLLAFVCGVLVFNIALFIQLGGSDLLYEPLSAVKRIAASRFGTNKELWGSFVFLEPQALYINIAAMIVFYIAMISKKIYQKLGYIFIFLLFLFFLLLTETKSAFLSFSAGILILVVFLLKGRSLKYKLMSLGIVVGIVVLVAVLAPDSLKDRFRIAKTELCDVLSNDFEEGGTIVPRVTLYKVNFSHFNEFGWWGLGIAYTNTVKQWYSDSYAVISGLTDPHNSFVFFWLIGGLPGLVFVLGLFILPFWKMFKNKQFSFIMLAIGITLLIANNTTVLLSLNDSKPLILFFLSLFYWGYEGFRSWEVGQIKIEK